jgi:hypothetical protein
LTASRILDYGEETLSRSFQRGRLQFAAFGRAWPSIFAKMVQQYWRPLPSRAWHDENNSIAVCAGFRQRGALRDLTKYDRSLRLTAERPNRRN